MQYYKFSQFFNYFIKILGSLNSQLQNRHNRNGAGGARTNENTTMANGNYSQCATLKSNALTNGLAQQYKVNKYEIFLNFVF